MTDTITGLSREQLTMLRRANDVWFTCDHVRGINVGRVCLRLDDVSSEPIRFECEARIVSYAPHKPYNRAYVGLVAARHESQWVTVSHLLRPGDRLTLVFEADLCSTSDVLAAGLHADVFTLQVDRKGKRYFFCVGYSTFVDGPNRMVS